MAIIARQPHSIGTSANAAVRDYIVRRCRALGCSTTMQDPAVLVASSGQLTLGRVQNIITQLPGRSGQPLRVAATTHSLGLPAGPELPLLPASFVAMSGFSSFTTQVQQQFRL